MDQLLLGVSTRGYAASLEVAPSGTRSRATSKSAVSRRLVAATRTQLAAQLGRRLDELDLVALFLDGVDVTGQTLIVALGVAPDASKTPPRDPARLDGKRRDLHGAPAGPGDPGAAPRRTGVERDRRRQRIAQGARGCAGDTGVDPTVPTAQAAQSPRPGPPTAPAVRAGGAAPGVSGGERVGGPPPVADPDELAREQRASRRRS